MDLRLCFLFKDLNQEQLDRISSMAKEIPVEKDQRILTGGDEASALHILKEGSVELMMKIENELELPIAILRKAGNCFGTSALIPTHLYSLSARCVKEGTLLIIDRSSMQQAITEDRDLGCIVMTNAARFYLERLKQARQELKIHFTTLLKAVHS